MTVFTVHERAMPALAPAQRANELVFVREGFSWLAFLVGGLWLLLRGLWLEFLGFLGVAMLTAALLLAAGMPAQYVQTVLFFFNIILGFELYDLQRWKLERQGYKMIGVASGNGQEEAERRFFASWLPAAQAERDARGGPRPAANPTGTPGAGEGPVIGFSDWGAKA